MYLEDAVDLAAWRTRVPAYEVEGRTIYQSPVPPLDEWLAEVEDAEAVGDFGGFLGTVGNILGLGG